MASTDYQWLFRRAPAMVTSIGEDGRYRDISDAFLDRLGFSRKEMVGQPPSRFVTEESAQRIDKEFRPALRRTGRLKDKPIAFVAKDGEIVHCLTDSIVETGRKGAAVRTIAMYRELDIQAQANLKYRQLYRATPAMLHTVDASGRIITVTDHWLRKMGYTREEVVGRPVTDFFSKADRERLSSGKLKDLLSTGTFENQARQLVTHDGQVLELLVSATAVRDSAGRVQRLLVASKDVTERNRAERALRDTLAENARLREELERERDYLREEVNVAMDFGRIVGRSPALKYMLSQVDAVAQTPASVLILGESGVGKELVAHAIHARSSRADAPLVKVNCASIPKELFESEFFGHVKGAFTGAHRDRVGRFQLADGGTIFLDEVGEIPIELQGKLLRVLQESEFERVGDDITRSVDVRVIAATNRDLEELVVNGEFREDLYYRLSVFPISVPPLRRRQEDLPQLAQHFLDKACTEFGRTKLKLTNRQVAAITAYDWPGNVRELKNVIERAVILAKDETLRLELSMPDSKPDSDAVGVAPAGDDSAFLNEIEMRQFQKENLRKALQKSNWRVSGKGGAADLLGLRPTTLADRIKSFELKRPG
ncbi:MAG: sigma 54-interacting transcriptional regulator [Woeseia sp.]|nr:sigma 54-interacting transcriptional regulator [Woeseia sp.]MBT8095990.1 sigma 54-interacting transcriptional regulator [Woeseia sp.]NNL54337.1 sigma 54-interacting transcriptional regulator [Woeseia sp.]